MYIFFYKENKKNFNEEKTNNNDNDKINDSIKCKDSSLIDFKLNYFNNSSYQNNNSAMSIYGDLDVHGNINIIDDFGSNYNFRLSNLSASSGLLEVLEFISTYS